MNYVLIVNPRSGGGRSAQAVKQVKDYFAERGQALAVWPTGGPGGARDLAARAVAEGYGTVIVAGGDGTINEALNGMVGGRAKLAILPWGTGNVFAQEMGFPSGVKRLCRMILRGESLALDLGTCNGRAFLLMAGCGIDAYSLRIAERQGLKRLLGVGAYAFAALRAGFRYGYPRLEARLPGGEKREGSFILVSNTSRYGSFFSFTPAADPRDGKLDLFALRGAGLWDSVLLALRGLLSTVGLQWRWPGLLHPRRAKRVAGLEIHGPPGARIQLDGELADPLPVAIGVLPRAVEVILPKGALRRLAEGRSI